MSKFEVTQSELESAISTLTTLNGELLARLQEVKANKEAVDACWDGDANTQFNQNFTEDYPKYTEFQRLIGEYINTLSSIKNAYATAEAANKSTAASRSYGG